MSAMQVALTVVLLLQGFWIYGSEANQVSPPALPCVPEEAANTSWIYNGRQRVERPCSVVLPRLKGGAVYRECVNGSWSAVDFSGCLLPELSSPFVFIWYTTSSQGFNISLTATQLREILQLDSIAETTNISLRIVAQKSAMALTNVVVIMDFPGILAPNEMLQGLVTESLQRLKTSEGLGTLHNLGYRGLHVGNSCRCQSSDEVFDTLCCGVIPLPPCLIQAESTYGYVCHAPEFVGNGLYCSRDIDQDAFPRLPLSSCQSNSSQKYCRQDNCPFVHNPSQQIKACVAPPGFDGCTSERGARQGIGWGNTLPGETATQPCPSAQGFASRYCSMEGVWSSEVDVSTCVSYQFNDAVASARGIFDMAGEDVDSRLSMLTSVIGSFASLTEDEDDFSLLPQDLDFTNDIVGDLIQLLEETLASENETDFEVLEALDTLCTEIFSNVLEGKNLEGWQELTETGDGTPKLLDNMERYSLYVSQRSFTNSTRQLWMSNNFALSFMRKPLSSSSSIVFPSSVADLRGSLNLSYVPAQVTLPPQLFQRRNSPGSRFTRDSMVPSSIFLARNMELSMPLSMEGGGNASSIPSMIVSAQVNERGSTLMDIAETPVKLMFQFSKMENVTDDQYRCAYWKFSDPIGSGYWAFDGVEKVSVREDSLGRMEVQCTSTHLTSFAVLVDVAGSTSEDPITTEIRALTIVSYIGCVISVIFLVISIIFFLAQGRDLLKKMHYFIHLNLAITLCLGYTLFLVGGPTAIAIREACVAVAVVLHYLFLSSFCWMLCEGIMLYLLLVVVFSNASRKPWLFLLVGYALPVIPVVISVAVRHDSYGVTNAEGNLTFCWLSTADGLIWSFVGPMLLVIVANLFFLSAAIYKVFTTKRKRNQTTKLQKKYSSSKLKLKPDAESQLKEDLELVRTLVVSVIVLLPVLGVAWVLGVFAVNRNTTVFAWMFTIINSLQGLFIFFFHVVRSDKVWKSPRFVRLRSSLQVSQSSKETRLSSNTSSTFATSSTHIHNRKSTSGASSMNEIKVHERTDVSPSDEEVKISLEAIEEGGNETTGVSIPAESNNSECSSQL